MTKETVKKYSKLFFKGLITLTSLYIASFIFILFLISFLDAKQGF